jgi:hypothetical protein
MTPRPLALSWRLAAPLFLLTLALLSTGCHTLRLGPQPTEKVDKDAVPAAPAKCNLRVSQYVFFSDFELKRDLPIFKELEVLRDQVYKDLQLPAANTLVQVYLFEDRDHYERFMHAKYPELPRRRAFFVAQPRSVGGADDLLVYTYWGDRIQQDLRHELTHALLHSVLKDVPLWLDEGLAEYYELPADWKGVNYQHLEQMRRNTFKPSLERLEQLSQVQQMTPPEYREAWAWVHLMMQGQPEGKTVLLAYLQQLRTNPTPGPMAPHLAEVYPALDEALSEYLTRLDATPRPPATAQK